MVNSQRGGAGRGSSGCGHWDGNGCGRAGEGRVRWLYHTVLQDLSTDTTEHLDWTTCCFSDAVAGSNNF